MLRWHAWLASDLSDASSREIVIALGSKSQAWPAGIELVSRLDRLLHRLPGGHAIDRVSHDKYNVHRWADIDLTVPFDVVIDCTGGATSPPPARRILTPLFDGIPSELGAMAAILDGRTVEVAVHGNWGLTTVVGARPAISNKACLTEALDNVISRMVNVVVSALARAPLHHDDSRQAVPDGLSGPTFRKPRNLTAAGFQNLARIVTEKLRRKLLRTVSKRERWALALRRCEGPGLMNDWIRGGTATYTLHPDDGRRFYADPFLMGYRGKTYVFCEEYPHATERGLISAGEVHPDGTVGKLIPVLERPYHLSYPFVFEDAGQIWMIPEAAAGNGVELYRAVDFPWRWEAVQRLVEDVPACDATILRRDGSYWMFLTSPSRQSTSWDNLRLYHAIALQGPWIEHATSPILIDRKIARPAGAIINTEHGLIRPAQDCSEIYGGGIILSRIDRLNDSEFAQTVVGEIMPANSAGGIIGTHTYNKCGGFEAVDVWGEVDSLRVTSLSCRPLANSAF